MARRAYYFIGVAALLILGSPGLVRALSDTTPPTITSFSLSDSTADTTYQSVSITASATITDDLSGVKSATIAYTSPSGQSVAGDFINLVDTSFQAQLNFPKNSEAGTWTPSYLYLVDIAGNNTILYPSDLQNLGFNLPITITSVTDTTPPTITSFSLSDSTADTTYQSVSITASATITDDLSGVKSATIAYTSPSGQSVAGDFINLVDTSFQAQLNFPKNSEAGTWTPSYLYLVDIAGNNTILYPSDLQNLGFNLPITITSVTDTTPPVLTGLTLSKITHDVSGGPAVVIADATITDDLSGVKTASMRFESPNGSQSTTADFYDLGNDTFQAQLVLPQYLESGVWRATFFAVSDHAGNTSILTEAQLKAAGMPFELSISKDTVSTLDPGGTLSSDTLGVGATPSSPVEVAVTNPVGGTTSIIITPIIEPQPNGFQFLGNQINISTPDASAVDPLLIDFRIDPSIVPAGDNEQTIQMFRNGTEVPACDELSMGTATPDPCIASRSVLLDGDIDITVRSSQASSWTAGRNLIAPPPSNTPDLTPPVLNVPSTITASSTGPGGAAVSFGATASDPDDAVASLACTPASGAIFPIGTNTVTCTAVDAHGNTATASFSVIVIGLHSNVTTGVLTATSDGAEPIAVTCQVGLVKINDADPDSGPAACATITSMNIGGGPGDNTIDLRGVDGGAFPFLTAVSINGGDGNDTIYPSRLTDNIYCGTGNDTVSYAGRTNGVRMTIGDGPNDGEPGENDNIHADCENLTGGSGNDALVGNGGANILDGGAGNDWFSGGLGSDSFICGAGSDIVSYTTRTNPLFVTVGGGPVSGEAGEGDSVSGDCETIYGGSGNDTLIGDNGDNNLYGFAGNDTLIGNGGNDVLDAGSGNNILDGGPGDDKLIARNSFADTITCGAGNDYAGLDLLDIITDPGSCEIVKQL